MTSAQHPLFTAAIYTVFTVVVVLSAVFRLPQRWRERRRARAHAAWVAKVRLDLAEQRDAPPGFGGVSSHGIPRDDWRRFCREIDAVLDEAERRRGQ